MASPAILLVGGTGQLGSDVARRLARDGVSCRALVRPTSDAARLRSFGAEVVAGDLRDPASLAAASEGVETVVTTATALGRLLGGDRSVSIQGVDVDGNANLLTAAENAGVKRLLFVSMGGGVLARSSPLVNAKVRMEARLAASPVREVIVRPDMFQEVWLSPEVGFDWPNRKVRLYGRGETKHRYVGIGDVAEAIVRLVAAEDPPRVVELNGATAISAMEAVAAFEQRLGVPIKVSHVPRLGLRIGAVLMRPLRPELASVMSGALQMDLASAVGSDEGFRALGIDPRPVESYIENVTRRES